MTAAHWSAAEAERYLDSLELFGMRFGLERMRRLMTALGSPHSSFDSVHVVGTNGKSSTARMVAAILRRQGIRTGAYLSPHVESLAERIEVEERPVPPERLGAAVQAAAQAAGVVERKLEPGDRVTQFEALTAAAYFELARAGVELAVVEAGLGGRYDATSVIASEVQVVTNVALEHTRWLGPTERHIAEEKLAVVPEGGRIVAGPLRPDPLDVATRTARERHADLLLAGRDFSVDGDQPGSFAVRTRGSRYPGIHLRALGDFQRSNFALAVATAEEVVRTRQDRALDPEAVREAAADLRLPGRLEPVAHDPLVIFDGAHNPAAASALRSALDPLLRGHRPVLVTSVLDDKDTAGILSELLPVCRAAVLTRSSHSRALPPGTLESLCRQLAGPPSEIVPEPGDALRRARHLAGAEGVVLVAGSIYLLSDLARLSHGASRAA